MKRKQYKDGNERKEAIRTVAACISKYLGATLGPGGRDFQTPDGITNDGKKILGEIRFDDECEDNVALAFHEIANRTDQDAGDNTTTSVVLGTTLTLDLLGKLPDLETPIQGQKSVMDFTRELEEEKNKAVALLETKKVVVNTLEQLEQVAFTSMEDKEVAKVVADVIFKAGPNSFTALEEGFNGKIETSMQAGIELPLKIEGPWDREVVFENVPVLVANHLFENYQEFSPFMASLVEFLNENKSAKFPALVVIGKQFSIPFVQAVSRVNAMGHLKILCLSNSHLSDELFGDAAAFCDAQLIDTHPKTGNKITDVKFNQCGMVAKVVATPKGTVLFGGKGSTLTDGVTTRVQERVMEITKQLDAEKDTTKREALQRRRAEFQGGKATIYVDAKTAAEKYYLKEKVKDCMNSCKGALESGMVRGGGLTLKEVAEELGADSLLYNALVEPYKRIQLNAGGKLEIGDDVWDSLLGAKAGIENSVSVVKTLIRLEGIIADVPPSMVEELGNVLNR
jgi:chaperonin GroEL